jgi:ribokinase
MVYGGMQSMLSESKNLWMLYSKFERKEVRIVVCHDTDIILYGSLNVDFVAFVDHLPTVGETISTRQFQMVAGGKAANQAVAASRLGSNVAMVGRVGDDDMGRMLKAQLVQDGVHDHYVWLTEGVQTGISMVSVDVSGHNTIVTYLGANTQLSKKDIDDTDALLDHARFVILQMEMEHHVGEYIIRKAHQKGVRLVFNLAPVVPIKEQLLRMVSLLIVNETEASQLTGAPVASLVSAERAATVLYDRGIENVIITLGERGAILKTPAGLSHFPSPEVHVVDTTAAGDCFVAATTHFWNQTGDLRVAVQSAVAVAALSVTKRGAQSSLPFMAEYQEYMKSKGY